MMNETINLPGIVADRELLRALIKLKPIDAEIIIAFAKTNMNFTKTGSIVYLHRGSVVYRIAKMGSRFGFNLRDRKTLDKLLPIVAAIVDGRRDKWFE